MKHKAENRADAPALADSKLLPKEAPAQRGRLERARESAQYEMRFKGATPEEPETSLARFRHLAAVAQPVWIADLDNRLLFANQRWHDYFGTQVAACEAGDWHCVLHPDDSEEALGRIRALCQSGQPYQLDLRLRRADGEYRWHQVNVEPVRENGNLTGWCVVHTDIHERKENEVRLQMALQASGTGIWSWDIRTDVMSLSPESHDILGMATGNGSITKAAFLSSIHSDDLPRVERAVRAAIEAQTHYVAEFRLLRPDGSIRWVKELGRCSYDGAGRPERMFGTIVDISQRKESEEELQQQRLDLQKLADNAPDVIARFDRELRHVYINAAIERFTGRPAADFLGRTNRELGMAPALCDAWESRLRAIFASGQPSAVDFELPAADGPRFFSSRIVPERSPDGDIETLLCLASDVTAQRKAEEDLRASEERLTRAQRAAQVGTWDWNIDTDESQWTEEAWRLFGRAPFSARVDHAFFLGCVHPDDRERVALKVRQALESGTYRDEFRVRHPNGTILWLNSAGEAVFGRDKKPERLLGTVRDVTKRREAQQTLRRALEQAQGAITAQDRLMSLVSHDLRNPLATLVTGVAILGKQLPDGGGKLIQRMTRQAKRMENLIDELLDVSQLQAGHPLTLHLEDVELVSLIRGLVEEQQQLAPKHRIEVRTALEALNGRWDRQRLERVICNLLSNAIKYSPAGGLVGLTLDRTSQSGGTWAVLEIIDQGIGIGAVDQSRIFDWYARGENARRARIQGTGIGLAGAKEIVEQGGGTISVKSQEGLGATFTVRIPTASPDELRRQLGTSRSSSSQAEARTPTPLLSDARGVSLKS